MSRPVLLQEDFSGGAMQDKGRGNLPDGKVWMMTDMLPSSTKLSVGVTYPVGSRYGWARPYNAMSATTSSYAAAVGFAPYSGGTRILGIDEDGRLYKWTPGSTTTTNVGAAVVPAHAPVFYRNYAYIFDVAGSAAGYRYDGTTLSNISGSPPTGSVGCVFKDHLVTAHSSSNTNRVWFASAGDPTSWDTAANGQWLDCSSPVQGLATFQNMILAFEEGLTERIRGDIIPGVVGSDFVREPLFRVGCSDPASIAVADNFVIFANSQGVYVTDGLLPYDLTAQCGMSSYWRYQLTNYASSWTIAGALWHDWYVFSVCSAPGTLVLAGAINVKTKSFLKFTNVKAQMIASAPIGVSELLPNGLMMAEGANPYVSDIGGIVGASTAVVGSTSYQDGDGTAITPSIETGFFRSGKNWDVNRWRELVVKGRLITSESARVTVAYIDDPSTTGYTTLTSSLNLGSSYTRNRVAIGKNLAGIGFKLSATLSSLTPTFTLDALEAVIEPLGGRRRP